MNKREMPLSEDDVKMVAHIRDIISKNPKPVQHWTYGELQSGLLAEQGKTAKLEAEVRELASVRDNLIDLETRWVKALAEQREIQGLLTSGAERWDDGYNKGVERGTQIGEDNGQQERDKLLALLRKYEWLSDRYDADYCGTCHGDRSDGHTPDCAIGNALEESG